MRKYSRLVSIEERKARRQTILFFLGAAILLFILVFFGLPTLAQIAAFLADLRRGTTPVSVSDTIPPAPPRFFQTPTATNSARLVLTGTAEAGSLVSIFQDAKQLEEIVSGDDGIFQKEVTLLEGENIFWAKTKDSAGNESQESERLTLVFDKQPPELKVTEPAAGASFSGEQQKNLTIRGKTEAGAAVTVNERLAIVDSDGNFSYRVTLNPGANEFKILAVDQAGNQKELLLQVTFSP